MKRTTRLMAAVLVTVLLCALLAGCQTYRSYTYNCNTGEKVKLQLNTTNDLQIEAGPPFVISRKGEVLAQGDFLTEGGYRQYVDAVHSAGDSVTIYEETSNEALTWLFYHTEGSSGQEYNYIIQINGAKAGVVVGSQISRETAEEVFEALTFSIEK